MIGRVVVGVLAAAVLADPARAQPKERIPPLVVDLRVASSGLPTMGGWTPSVPAATVLPTRGVGVDLGAHIYVLRFRRFAFGVGASWFAARASTSPPEPAPPAPGALPVVRTIPDVATRVRGFAPQVSLSFGHRLGWSYLSGGLGRGTVVSEATLPGAPIPFEPRESERVKTLNYGGGARWFINDHVGIGLDLRWHKLGLVPVSDTHPGAGRASMLVASGGVVLK